MICRRRGAEALQDRDAADLLPDEHARDARHADAAEDDDDQADQAQVVLRPGQVLAHLVLGPLDTSARSRTVPAARRAAPMTNRSNPSGRSCSRICRLTRLPAARQAGGLQRVGVHEHAGPEAERSHAVPGSTSTTPRTVKRSCPDEDRRRPPPRRAARAAPGEPGRRGCSRSAWAYECPPSSSTRAVEGKARDRPRGLPPCAPPAGSSAGRTIVFVSTTLGARRSRIGVARRCSTACRVAGVPRPARWTMTTSAAMSERASPASVRRTSCTTERSSTMPPTPRAMQRKKSTSRRQEARSSRSAMRTTKRRDIMSGYRLPGFATRLRPNHRAWHAAREVPVRSSILAFSILHSAFRIHTTTSRLRRAARAARPPARRAPGRAWRAPASCLAGG